MRIKRQEQVLPEIDMTPMIDIVFQLIAFFMVISNFEQTQADERVKLPRNALAKPAEVAREKELTLNVGFVRDATGKKTSGVVVFYAGEDKPVPVAEMPRFLDRETHLYRDLKTDPRTVTVVIRADAEVATGQVQELIKMSQDVGFEKFAMKATQRIDQ